MTTHDNAGPMPDVWRCEPRPCPLTLHALDDVIAELGIDMRDSLAELEPGGLGDN